ncbi:hypothetical protein BH09ACT12_BH09ACT12_36930 [soil metagenome]
MSTRPLTAPVIAALVVLVSLGLGAVAVTVLMLLGAGPSTSEVAPERVVIDAPEAGAPGPSRPAPGATGATTSRAREVLREWDSRREAAWAAADERALRALYVPHALAGRRDVALLRRWTARGARITRLEPQVLELRVVRDAGRQLVVRVTDRLGVLEARVHGDPIALPHDEPTTRRIELRRGPQVTSRWRVASVRGVRDRRT